VRRALGFVLVLAGLVLAPAVARAQEHGEHPEHPGQTPGHGEHGGGEVHEGFHNPGPMNWTSLHPDEVVTHHGTEEVRRPGPPPFLAPIVNFLILATILYMAIQRSVNPALAERRAAVETELAEARRLKDAAEALLKECKAREARLDDERRELAAELRRAGEQERDRLVAEARQRAERMRAAGAAAAEQELKNLREALRQEAVLLAAAAAEEAVRKALTADDQRRLADGYVSDLEALAPTPTTSGAQS
jgi:F-type H+-transporting ATPase subunit b